MSVESQKAQSEERREPGIIVRRSGHIATVLFDRPERGNAFGAKTLQTLEVLWRDLDSEKEVRVIVLASTSDKFFCTGRDLKEAAEIGVGGDMPLERLERFTSRLAGVWKPLISAVEGKVVGGGLNFVLDADITIAGEGATFLDPHVDIGHVAGRSSITLPRKVGVSNALYLALGGQAVKWDAQRAFDLGLVQEVVPAGGALNRATQLAMAIAEHSPSAIAKTMEAMWSYGDTYNLDQSLRHSWTLLRRQRDHPDSQEGPQAFVERRKPRWM
jgi:E-phenylitaconyl-CoA hydratase